MDNAKIAVVNTGSWLTTIISVEYMKDVAQLLALGGSITVSIASLWWIARQAKALEKRDRNNK
tara:strand:- start:195 stop:383 length:189 start_codon:yes stop_codon:yes gene_type:complete